MKRVRKSNFFVSDGKIDFWGANVYKVSLVFEGIGKILYG
jgi:hypothetical protein